MNLGSLKVAQTQTQAHCQDSQARPLITLARSQALQMVKDNLIGTIAAIRHQKKTGCNSIIEMAS